jgi:hypothetical protein
LLKWSYDGHLLEYGQMAQVSKPIRLLLQIKISKKKKSQMNPGERLQAPEGL